MSMAAVTTDSATGAAIGTAVFPGVGTAIGTLAGAIAGLFTQAPVSQAQGEYDHIVACYLCSIGQGFHGYSTADSNTKMAAVQVDVQRVYATGTTGVPYEDQALGKFLQAYPAYAQQQWAIYQKSVSTLSASGITGIAGDASDVLSEITNAVVPQGSTSSIPWPLIIVGGLLVLFCIKK